MFSQAYMVKIFYIILLQNINVSDLILILHKLTTIMLASNIIDRMDYNHYQNKQQTKINFFLYDENIPNNTLIDYGTCSS